MAKVAKEKDLPIRRSYVLGPNSNVEISMAASEGSYRLQVTSSRSSEEVCDANFKRVANYIPSVVWKVLDECLSRCELPPCEPVAHRGADEILALYRCIGLFRREGTFPRSCTVSGSRGTYEIFSAKEKGDLCEMNFKTHYVYGNPLNVKSEVESTIAQDRATKIVSAILGEWLKPDYVKTLRSAPL